MAPLRTEIPVSYKTAVKRTLVDAFRQVFTIAYPDEHFQDLKITTEYPLKEINYPALLVEFEDSQILNAGVGHHEIFNDDQGVLRNWNHRRFEGSLNITVLALSPLDRDVLSDAVIEILSFGRLDPLQSEFFDRVYGDPSSPYSALTLLNQLNINTDIINSGGGGPGLPPWEPEDTFIYQHTYTVDITGGFYNNIVDPPIGIIDAAIQKVYTDTLPPDDDPENPWSFPFSYYDADCVVGKFELIDPEDADTITGRADIWALDNAQYVDIQTAIGTYIDPADEAHHMIDAGQVDGSSTISGIDTKQSEDIQTSVGISGIITDNEIAQFVDVQTATGVYIDPADDIMIAVDNQISVGSASPSGVDIYNAVDSGEAIGGSTPSATFEYTDAATISGVPSVITTEEVVEWVDEAVVTGVPSVVTTEEIVELIDEAVVTGTGSISGNETHETATINYGVSTYGSGTGSYGNLN